MLVSITVVMSGTGVLLASEVVHQWRTIADALAVFRISEASWKSLAAEMGDADVTDLEMIASITDDDYEAARDGCGAKGVAEGGLQPPVRGAEIALRFGYKNFAATEYGPASNSSSSSFI